MNHRDNFHRKFLKSKLNTDWNMYKSAEKHATNIRRAQKTHYKSVLRDSEKNLNKFWKMIKTIFPIKTKEPSNRSFNIDANCTTNKKSIASGFCSFFLKIAGALKEKLTRFKNFIWSTPCKAKTKAKLGFKLIHVIVSEVFVKLKKLKHKKATGSDNLPSGFLKDVAIIIAKPLSHIINLSIATDIVPPGFKIGLITSVYENGPKNDMHNYCPITVLPVCSKIFEQFICKQLTDFLGIKQLAIKPPVQLQIKLKHRIGWGTFHRSHIKKHE